MALSKHRYARFGLAVALLAFGGADSAYWERCAPQPREIFSGVTYGCEGLERTEQGQGKAVDLAPAVCFSNVGPAASGLSI